ncbi:MAG: S9 family peptidase [Acidobacteria bacterium]|nr:S9 family peptidase [Acidobacteriota bacterium]MBV9146623.1 S9 family peptidase [Acidobacteriota bacterium]MBV9437100.1 S9 family peptidase [Acidobacteriota bacterium]
MAFAADVPQREVQGGHGIVLPPPPATEAKPVTDNVAGHTLTDSYRWLEDQNSPETRAWIDAQMGYTAQYLSQVKIRPEMVKRLTELHHVEVVGIPVERNDTYFYTKRLPDENQASIYIRKGLHGNDERLIDATKLSEDQNTSVHINDISKDASLLVYGVREGGADEETVHFLAVADRKDLADVLPKARYQGVSLSPDKQGLYYAKYQPEGTLVYYHHIGSAVDSDQLVFGKEYKGEQFGQMELISSHVTENGNYLLISVSHGVPAKRVDIYAKDLRQPESELREMIHGIDSRFTPVNYGDDLYVLTDYNAENYRVIKVSMADPTEAKWQIIVPESKDAISGITIAGGKLFVTGLHDVVTQTRIFDLNGKQVATISYPTLGSASEVRGRQDSNHSFYTFESFNIPPVVYHYDVASGKAEIFAKPNVPFKSDAYEVRQIFYNSKDGTRVPMFISSKKGLKRDGSTPTLMFAYGGFLIPMTAHWDPEFAWWMEQGGFYAQPNLRGGGEYGEAWHKAGMFEKKQNVFDDFFAAAEYLIQNKYTSQPRLAIRGRSNGGLLMGAALTQRPDLFGAVWVGYPLLDMIRFQKFLVGRWWTSEYGSADNPDQFPYLIKYSPYQNVKPGTKYPAIMLNTGDSDTRVAPLHARKMTAELQADDASNRPVLLHYETKAGHSAGVSIQQLVNDTADELAFLWNETSK